MHFFAARATTRSRQRGQPETSTIESLPVSLPITALSRNSGSQLGANRTDKSKSSHSVSAGQDGDDLEVISQETDAQSKTGGRAVRPVKSQRKKGHAAASSGADKDGSSAEEVTAAPQASSGAAHVSVIKRTPEKRGGSRPFGRAPKDLPVHAPAIDTAQIASLLSEVPHETDKASRKAKSPGRSPGRSPAARVQGASPKHPQSASPKPNSKSTSSGDSNAPQDTVNVATDVQHADIDPQPIQGSLAIPQKKGRGRPRKYPQQQQPAPGKRPVGRPRKDANLGAKPSSNSGSPQRKKAKLGDRNSSVSPTRSGKQKGSGNVGKKDKANKGEKTNNCVVEEVDDEVEEITNNAEKTTKKKRVRKLLAIPPAFPEKDPYDFDALSISDFKPLPDLGQKRKRRKSKGFDFELESRRKKKKKKKPATPEER